MDFDYATVHTYSAAIFGTNVDVGKGIADLLVTDLVKDGTFSIIERKALDKIMAEQNFSNSNRADPTSAAKLGKLLGVDAILVGSITEFGNETKKTNLGGGGGNWHGFGAGRIRPLQLQGQRGHRLPAWSTSIPAKSLPWPKAWASPAAPAPRCSAAAATGTDSARGNADFGSSDFQNTIIGEATKLAIDKLTADLVSDAPKVAVRTITVEGLVAAVDGGQIILNVGASAGVKVGDQLEVVRVTKEIKDPATGNVLRRLTTTVGVVRATDVDDVSAICTPVSGSGFKAGDRVKSVTQ